MFHKKTKRLAEPKGAALLTLVLCLALSGLILAPALGVGHHLFPSGCG